MGPSLRRCCCRAIRALLLLLITAAPSAGEWRRLDSPNFIIIGNVGGSTLRDIAVKFEGFRETLGRVLNSQVTATAVPTVVIVFPDDRAFPPFMPKYEGRTVEVGGLFVPRQDVNYIALNSSGGDEALTVVFHEYSHLIISNVAAISTGGRDQWVAHEYGKIQFLYAQLGLADRTAIEYFQGGHSIHGQGTFAFLDKHLR